MKRREKKDKEVEKEAREKEKKREARLEEKNEVEKDERGPQKNCERKVSTNTLISLLVSNK